MNNLTWVHFRLERIENKIDQLISMISTTEAYKGPLGQKTTVAFSSRAELDAYQQAIPPDQINNFILILLPQDAKQTGVYHNT